VIRARPTLLALSLALAFAPAAPVVAKEPIVATAPGQRPPAGTDEAELWYIMEREERYLRESPYLVRDPALNDYVRSVTCKVTDDFCKDLRIYIMDVPFFNASMAPNGTLVLWTGALLRAQSEAELALVIGHEFGHYRERHTLQQWRKIKKSSAWLSAFGIVTAGVGAGIAGLAADLIGVAGLSKFSRDKEREADRIGFEILHRKGYDTGAGVTLWEGMLREEQARDYGKPLPVFASHPQTRERLEDLRAAAAAVTAAGAPAGDLHRDEYRAVMKPYLRHWLDNELTRRMFSSSIQVISDLRKTSAGEDLGLFTYYLGEAYRRRGKAGDLAQANALYATAINEPGAPADAWREHGLALRAAGQKAEAAAALRRYLTDQPQADDRAFVEAYVRELEATP
jgi:predicted Zn-dependent protease